jgi:hypothetical protein
MRHGRLRSPAASFGARILVLAACGTLVLCNEARADWLITPWIGTTFGIDTAYLTLETGARSRNYAMLGVSGGWLSSQVFGIEGEFAFSPGFFEVDEMGNPLEHLLQSSHLTTLFGNVIVATPLSVSGDSLRPYLLGGLGWVNATMNDQIGLVNSDASLGLQLGGGAIGFVSNRAALRFDLRNVRTLSRTATLLGQRDWKLSFWRASIGVTIRY